MKMTRIASTVGIGFFGGLVVTAFFRYPPNSSSDWASWVQAVGSISAIVAGAMFIRYQARLSVRQRHESVLAMMELAIEAVGGNTPRSDSLVVSFAAIILLNIERMKHIHGALSVIPLHEIASAEIVTTIGETIEILRAMIQRGGSEELVAANESDGSRQIYVNIHHGEVDRLLDARDRIRNAAGL